RLIRLFGLDEKRTGDPDGTRHRMSTHLDLPSPCVCRSNSGRRFELSITEGTPAHFDLSNKGNRCHPLRSSIGRQTRFAQTSERPMAGSDEGS
ncbi:MAG: hypothetical protein AAFX06_14845, partial [Planctomycetota bacterium]